MSSSALSVVDYVYSLLIFVQIVIHFFSTTRAKKALLLAWNLQNLSMFIVISKKFLIINSADIVEPEKEPGSNVSVFDLRNDSSEPLSIQWPPEIVPSSKESKLKQSGNPRVICGCVSPSEDLIALCDDQKNLVIFNNSFEAIYHFVVNRTCIKILFRSDEKAIFSCDKSGDIYEFCLSESKSQEKLLLGHCSMLLDFVLTPDDRYIIRYCNF